MRGKVDHCGSLSCSFYPLSLFQNLGYAICLLEILNVAVLSCSLCYSNNSESKCFSLVLYIASAYNAESLGYIKTAITIHAVSVKTLSSRTVKQLEDAF